MLVLVTCLGIHVDLCVSDRGVVVLRKKVLDLGFRDGCVACFLNKDDFRDGCAVLGLGELSSFRFGRLFVCILETSLICWTPCGPGREILSWKLRTFLLLTEST